MKLVKNCVKCHAVIFFTNTAYLSGSSTRSSQNDPYDELEHDDFENPATNNSIVSQD